MSKNRPLLLFVLIIGLLTVTQVVFAVETNGIDQIIVRDCTIFVDYTVAGDGIYEVRVYDDGTVTNTTLLQNLTAGSYTFSFPVPAVIGNQTTGITVQLITLITIFRIELVLETADSFETDTSVTCDNTPVVTVVERGCRNPITADAVQGRLQYTLQALFAPLEGTTTNVTLNVGSSWWIVAGENGFYKLFIACDANYVWVPDDAMGPNFDAVWAGRPLPSE